MTARSWLLRGAALAAVLSIAGLTGWLVLGSDLLDVDRVAVTGTGRTTGAQVQAAAAVPLGTPLARVDADAVRRRVGALGPVHRVEVRRGWPGTLHLRVQERQPVAGVVSAGRVTLLDREGVPFASAAALPSGTVRLQVPRASPGDPATRAALQVLGELPDGLRGRLAGLQAPTPSAVSLLMRDGRQVMWGSPARTQDKAAAAEALLRLPGKMYDVTSPEVVVRR